jgi:hypothetical protein
MSILASTNLLMETKKQAQVAKSFEQFELSLTMMQGTGIAVMPEDVDKKYKGRSGLKRFYKEFHK